MSIKITPVPTKLSVAFLGLGTMGYPMAGHLARAGHAVTVYNRTESKALKWLEEYSQENKTKRAAMPIDAAWKAKIVFACVGNDDDLRSITLGKSGAFAGMKPGTVFVDHSTTSADVAKELAEEAAKHAVEYMDAPVSGGQAGAEKGTLTIMAGGSSSVYERVKPIVSAYAQAFTLIGPAGSGQMAKMVNQICLAGLIQGLAEAVAFGQHAGLDMKLVLDVISKGAAQSWQMENRGETMVEGRFDGFGFAVDWMRKDLGLALDMAKRTGASLPVTALVDQFYAQLQASGSGRSDTSALLRLLQKNDVK